MVTQYNTTMVIKLTIFWPLVGLNLRLDSRIFDSIQFICNGGIQSPSVVSRGRVSTVSNLQRATCLTLFGDTCIWSTEWFSTCHWLYWLDFHQLMASWVPVYHVDMQLMCLRLNSTEGLYCSFTHGHLVPFELLWSHESIQVRLADATDAYVKGVCCSQFAILCIILDTGTCEWATVLRAFFHGVWFWEFNS